MWHKCAHKYVVPASQTGTHNVWCVCAIAGWSRRTVTESVRQECFYARCVCVYDEMQQKKNNADIERKKNTCTWRYVRP